MENIRSTSKQIYDGLRRRGNLPCRFRSRKKKTAPSSKSQYVFAQFDTIYGRLWESKKFLNDSERDEYIYSWNEALEPIALREIEAVCDQLSLLPQDELPHIITPKRFMGYCKRLKPEALGFVSFNMAFNECYVFTKHAHRHTDKKWSHPVIFAASMELYGTECLSMGNQKSEFSLFKRAYMRHIRRFIAGKAYKEPPHVQPILATKSNKNNKLAESHLSKLRGVIKEKTA
ncbi:hypothetical protein ACR9PT_10310 [Piscirickettsia salmonis]|uniref:hypothetical protein n=1 Tax=Piscirickettsia salmonis TaxID=1238 RepID=UPI003EBD89EC